MDIQVLIMNLEHLKKDTDEENGLLFSLPLNKDEVMDRLGFDVSMTGYFICAMGDLLREDIEGDTPIEEVNRLYHMLEFLEGKVHADDIEAVRRKWFSRLKEMCENSSFICWSSGEDGLENAAQKKLETYADSIPDEILRCVDIRQYANTLFSDESYLVTAHGVYSFDEPVY